MNLSGQRDKINTNIRQIPINRNNKRPAPATNEMDIDTTMQVKKRFKDEAPLHAMTNKHRLRGLVCVYWEEGDDVSSKE